MAFDNFQQKLLQEDPFPAITGQEYAKQQLKSALIMKRHVLILGAPGIGKTTIAKSVAALLPELTDKEYKPPFPEHNKKITGTDRFVRIQGSPDLTVEDIFGDIDPSKALKHGPTSIEAFTPGKLFKAHQGVLFFDELNRCPEKIQNALLQVLEEGKVTLGAYTVDFPIEFIFIGTMNPDETSATEKLSDVLLDRFDIIHMTHPETVEMEKHIVTEKAEKFDVEFPDKILTLTLTFIHELRRHKDILRKPSVRASIGLYERAQANATISNRKTVNAQDILDAILSVLSHRIELKPSVKYLQTNEQFLKEQFQNFSNDHEELNGGGGL